MTYYNNFSSWADVQRDFTTNEPEPQEVLVADYDYGGYEGSAIVVYRNGMDYYIVEGSHCSCFGLENQWQPEHYDYDTLLGAVEKWPDDSYGVSRSHNQEILNILRSKVVS